MTALRISKWAGSSSDCLKCHGSPESVLHVLRDCPVAFRVTCWSLWKCRNASLFEEDFTMPIKPMEQISSFSSQIKDSFSQSRSPQAILGFAPCDPHFQNPRMANAKKLERWTKPPDGWIKLNVDGASKGNPGDAGCAGIFRGADGKWMMGFTFRIGTCSALEAELWGLYIGNLMAWNQGFRKLKIESDSKEAILLISKEKREGNFGQMVAKIAKLKNLDWEIQYEHIMRERNVCADWLAKQSFLRDYGFFEVTVPSSELAKLISRDVLGAGLSRSPLSTS